MNRILATWLFALVTLAVGAQELTLTVSNPTDEQREEVVACDLSAIRQRLGLLADEQLVVKNAFGQQVTYQQTYDGQLLLYVSVQPASESAFRIMKGRPEKFKNYVYGRMYPERADDIAWENDRGAYRVYGPALQRTGERSFGTDVWVKNTPEPVLEKRYRMHLDGVKQRDSLKRVGGQEAGEAIYVATSFHHDHGEGLDCYAVGPSLGCGTPALMRDGLMLMPWCYQDYRILDNGPLRFTVELTYGTTDYGTTEHRLISLDRGSHFCRCTVWYDGILQPMTLVAGVVVHGNEQHLTLGTNYVQYADPTDNPKANQTQIYVATLFPDGVSKTTLIDGEKQHAVGCVADYKGQPYTYYFGSAWSNYDVRNQSQWQATIDRFFKQVSNPLKPQLHSR